MKNKKRKNPRDPRLPFSEHILELRSRFFVYVLSLCTMSLVGYGIHPRLIALLTRPLALPLFYSTVTGGLDFVFQVSLSFGFLFSLPIFLYETYRFFAPALPPIHPRKVLISFCASFLLLSAGMGFAYFVSLPATLFFLASFATGGVQTLISTNEYLSFILRYIVGFGLVFQLPLILIVVDSVYPLPMKMLFQSQRIVIVLCFTIAAILTPTPDIVNQFFFALPLLGLYQLSVFLVWLRHRRASS